MSTLTFKERLPRYVTILSLLALVGWGLWVLTMDHFSAHRAAKSFGEAIKAKDYDRVNDLIDYQRLSDTLANRHYPLLEQRLLAYFPHSPRNALGLGGATETFSRAMLPFMGKVAALGLKVEKLPSAGQVAKGIIKKAVSPQTVMVLVLSQDQLTDTLKALGDLYIDLDHEGDDFADENYYRYVLGEYLRTRTNKRLTPTVSLDEIRERMRVKQQTKQDAYNALPEVTGMEVRFTRVDSTTARIRLAKGPLGNRQVDIIFTRPGMFEDWKIVDIKEV
ncbi:hypothetical protein [Marinobacterium sp. BA1]|uniref:hypothetical protein n=1 Tax=Marinobacterium sp. BA1 TaxID=3138931 RepID=UPI0032E6952D